MPGNGFIHNLGQCRGVEGHLTECSGTVSNKMCSNSSEDHLLDVALTCKDYTCTCKLVDGWFPCTL